MYRKRAADRFGKSSSGWSAAKPLKRPSQARAKFTVQAIFDAFVRIWRTKGWEGVTTRAVALETGVSVGTLYDYFPNKEALLSGYVRHCIDALLVAIEVQVIQPVGLAWDERMRRLVRLTGEIKPQDLPYFDVAMLRLESVIAEPKHHRRVFEELCAKWIKAMTACPDFPGRLDPDTVKILFASVWGARRYLLLLDMDEGFQRRWIEETTQSCLSRLQQIATSVGVEALGYEAEPSPQNI
ncbi:TetR/AcrR family transcriptional regulator [Noviherbaspirillum sp. 17J57-3]|uniref:TetR/AcrR family transcriptional regulator n=2 Tax=Noviherbaspirillum galbum TaxID=2709383 RepID=A0A6B3SV31_9BURK|nr:TetR/AcrR family transcriptional regulator [Noviherbaspirillum galbum]